MNNIPPNNRVKDSIAYEVASLADPSLRFRVVSDSEAAAKHEALDKIGYNIAVIDGAYFLVDADDHTMVECTLNSASTLPEAFTAAFKAISWEISEPIHMLGGAMSDGFGEMTEDNS